jgi:hypothetical protein
MISNFIKFNTLLFLACVEWIMFASSDTVYFPVSFDRGTFSYSSRSAMPPLYSHQSSSSSPSSPNATTLQPLEPSTRSSTRTQASPMTDKVIKIDFDCSTLTSPKLPCDKVTAALKRLENNLESLLDLSQHIRLGHESCSFLSMYCVC